ncbi:MAG TPA: RHS repeat-associated core domain-containing protein, partial [Vicinamibacteria bacterium]
MSFGYAPTGERVWRRDAAGVTYFVTDGVNVLAELDENFKSKATYLHARAIDAPLTMSRDGRTYFYHRERLGSTGLLTGERGEALASYDYDAFGALRRSEGAVANPFTYTAREFEPGIGLYYYRARYYDPGLGRFVSVDPVPPPLEAPLGLNPYLYAGNNPLRFVDPLGAEFTPEQQLWMAENSLQHMLECAEGRGGASSLPPGAFREDYLKSAQGFREQAEWLRNRPGIGAPDPPPGYGGRPFPTETPQTGGPGRVRAGGGAAPGQPAPGVTQDVPAPGARGGPTQAVPRGDVPAGVKPGSSDTRAVQPGSPSPGSGISWGRVGGGVVTGAVSAANIAACLTDPRNSAAQCAAEAGLIVVGIAGGALILSIPAVAAAVAGSTVVVPVVVITMTASGIYQATTRLVNSANAPAAIAEATRQAEMEARLQTVFPRMSANIEAKVAAFEAKASQTSAIGVGAARARAEAFADAAASNLATLRTDLAQIEASCTFAAGAYMDVLALVGDAEGRLIDLDTGLTA